MRTVNIDYNGTETEVKTDFSVIERVEQRFTFIDFLREVSSGNPKITSIAWVLYCALLSTGEQVQYSEIGQYAVDNFAEASMGATKIADACLTGAPEKSTKK